MFVTVFKEGEVHRVIRYYSKDVKDRRLDDCLGEEVFTLQGPDGDERGLIAKAKKRAKEEFGIGHVAGFE